MSCAYGDDLAYIHDAGFGGFARAAAPVLVKTLHQAGRVNGLVIDLGCGSGILSHAMTEAGYDVLGIDISPAMVAMARRRVPSGQFRCESLLTAHLPPSVAIAAVGECINYLFDRGRSSSRLTRLLRRIYTSLIPGGVLHPARICRLRFGRGHVGLLARKA